MEENLGIKAGLALKSGVVWLVRHVTENLQSISRRGGGKKGSMTFTRAGGMYTGFSPNPLHVLCQTSYIGVSSTVLGSNCDALNRPEPSQQQLHQGWTRSEAHDHSDQRDQHGGQQPRIAG